MINKISLSGTQLKFLGAFLMVLDHIHEMFPTYNTYLLPFTMLGRIVAPIFVYFVAEGYFYTSNKRKYIQRLLTGYWMMLLIDYTLPRLLPIPQDIGFFNNIFGTMVCITLIIASIESLKNRKFGLGLVILVIELIFSILPLVFTLETSNQYLNFAVNTFLTGLIPGLLMVEGTYLLVLFGVVVYFSRNHRWLQFLALGIFSLSAVNFSSGEFFTNNIQWMSIFAMIPLFFYNGTRGSGHKNFFYVFYPAHLCVLYVCSYLWYTLV